MPGARHVPYSLRWRPRQAFPGAHTAAPEGGDGDFRRHTSLLRHPDPRRIDLRVTLRDPFEEIQVRQLALRAAVNVFALVDLSGSMGFSGSASRMQAVAELCAVLARSAHKMGDRFGLVGCDSQVRPDLYIPATRRHGMANEVYRRLLGQVPRREGAEGLLEGARLLPAARGLVFLISDFLLPIPFVQRVLEALWRHDVIPVVLRDSLALPSWGITQIRDLESCKTRLLLLRPSVAREWQRKRQEHGKALHEVFSRHGLAPLELSDRFEIDLLARHLTAR
jgi:hypothetical protein